MPLSDYHSSAVDWRAQLKHNERQTHIVIMFFILIYLGVGLIVDTFLLQSVYPGITLAQSLQVLITLRVMPLATLLMSIIAIISLGITYALYDRIMLLGTEYREITQASAQTNQEKQLINVVEEMKVAAGLQFLPKIYIIEADYMNAFASGYSERSAMVAITRGLMSKLNRAELQAVIAHELSHIRHHDIKLNLTVAVLSNILLIAIDLLFYSVIYRRDQREENNRLFTIVLILRYVLPLLTVVLTLFLSRTREYMADAGCIELMRDNEPMARALLKIHEDHIVHAANYKKAYGQTAHEQIRQASYLFDPSNIDPVKAVTSLFSTHPEIEQRLKAIGFIKNKTNNG